MNLYPYRLSFKEFSIFNIRYLSVINLQVRPSKIHSKLNESIRPTPSARDFSSLSIARNSKIINSSLPTFSCDEIRFVFIIGAEVAGEKCRDKRERLCAFCKLCRRECGLMRKTRAAYKRAFGLSLAGRAKPGEFADSDIDAVSHFNQWQINYSVPALLYALRARARTRARTQTHRP